MLLDPFNREVRLPGDFTRQGRIALLGEFFTAIREGRMPSEEARIFVTSGALAWLENGGDLLGKFWKIKGPQGSNHTPAVVWSLLSASRSATSADEPGTIELSDSESVP